MTDWAAKVLAGVPRWTIDEGRGAFLSEAEVLDAIAKLADGGGLVDRATAALEGVTDGPWANDGFRGDRVEAHLGKGPDDNNYWESVADCEKSVDARFIAFTRQWVPEAADRIAALTAQVAEAGKMLAEQDSEYNRKTNDLIERHAKQTAALLARVARLECAGDFAKLIGNDAGKDDKDTVLVSYGMLRRLRAALTDGGKHV